MEVVVTATGTEIGKTVVSAVLLARWAGRGGVTYWKPVATGAEEGSDSLEVASLVGPEVRVLKECYRCAPPLSPHLAARMAGVEIEPERILSACRRHRESAGDGLLVVTYRRQAGAAEIAADPAVEPTPLLKSGK